MGNKKSTAKVKDPHGGSGEGNEANPKKIKKSARFAPALGDSGLLNDASPETTPSRQGKTRLRLNQKKSIHDGAQTFISTVGKDLPSKTPPAPEPVEAKPEPKKVARPLTHIRVKRAKSPPLKSWQVKPRIIEEPQPIPMNPEPPADSKCTLLCPGEDIDDVTLQLYQLKCPHHLVSKCYRLRPAWDDSPPAHTSKPKLRKVPPPEGFEVTDPCDVNCNMQAVDACPTFCQYHMQTKMPVVNLSQFATTDLKNSNLKMEGPKLDKDKSIGLTTGVNGNTRTRNSDRGENDVNGNFVVPTGVAPKVKMALKNPPAPRHPGDSGTASSATSSSVHQSKVGRTQAQKDRSLIPSNRNRSTRLRSSELKDSGEVVTIFGAKETNVPSSEYYETSPPISRQNYASSKASSELKVLPRHVHSEQTPGQGRLLASTPPSSAASSKINQLALEGSDTGNDRPSAQIFDSTDQIQNFSEPPFPEQSAEGFRASDFPLENTEQALPPYVSQDQQEASASPSASTQNSSEQSSSSSGSGETKSSKSSNSKSQSSKVASEQSHQLTASQKPSCTPKGLDPCECFPNLNYAYCPPRSNAFVAPKIRLRDIDKKYTAQIASSELAKEIPEDGSLNFGFSPRPDYGTQVTFSCEPKKAPIWKTMMRCGFVPIINCGVPPCHLSPDGQMDDSDSYDSYDSEYDYDSYDSSSSGSDDYGARGSNGKSGSSSYNSKNSASASSGSKSSGSPNTKLEGQSASGGSNQSANGNKKPKPKGQPDKDCETCGDDETIVVSAIGTGVATETQPDDSAVKLTDEKTLQVINI